MDEYLDELSIIIEEYPIFDGDECTGMGNYVIVNGDRVRIRGSILKSVLEHIGYVVDISYS